MLVDAKSDTSDNPSARSHQLSALENEIANLYINFGQRKPMGHSALERIFPHYFLLRWFLSDLDLLVILNTKRCRYRCKFCNLPAKSSPYLVPADDVLGQFAYVCKEMKHSLSVLDRITLSNEGSVLDLDTLPYDALEGIVRSASQIRSARRLVLETNLEFIDVDVLRCLQSLVPRLKFDILTGFETLNEQIRREILGKGWTIDHFEQGLDRLAEVGAALTCFVLLKPDPAMSDKEAVKEADFSIQYLQKQAKLRKIPLTIRLNPMYSAEGTSWATMANEVGFTPPSLSDALSVAKRAQERGIRVYLGLSSEGLATRNGTYMERDDFSRKLLSEAKMFNRFPSEIGKSGISGE